MARVVRIPAGGTWREHVEHGCLQLAQVVTERLVQQAQRRRVAALELVRQAEHEAARVVEVELAAGAADDLRTTRAAPGCG